ncbi:two-component system, OmpR family, sensor kinase [Agrococcus jejuensis]|uniref:histidine kinase n=1 Tax=Agrococcus jejuensis TaxID=399736 RepID=A0A1G8F2I5_9MICO|nr:two-component system, OmpR family, sensor kinase [Agrococcus jejuensis]
MAVVAAFVLLTSCIALASVLAMRGVLTNQLDDQIKGSMRAVLLGYVTTGDADVQGAQTNPEYGQIYAGTSFVFLHDGEPVTAGTLNGASPEVLSDENLERLVDGSTVGTCQTVSLTDGMGDQRVCTYPAAVNGQPFGDLAVALPLRGTYQTLLALSFVIAVSVFVAALALVALGDVLIRRALRPLTSVIVTTERISQLPLDTGEVQLSNRVRVSDPATEVGRVTESVNRMLEHIESSLEARAASERKVRQFVADASHELRTPLAAVQGYAEITRKHDASLSDDARESLGRIEAAAHRMSALVNDLLLLARLDEGTEIDRESVDLSLLVIDAVADAQVAGPDHPVALELPEEPVEVVGDLMRLQQVVANLLANARIHTPPGTHVEARLSTDGDDAVLEIADDGPGVPAELQATLFERFVRGDASRSRAAGSSGLGLAIVRAIMTAHGGSIDMRSAPGDTVFTIRVPLVASAAPAGSDRTD